MTIIGPPAPARSPRRQLDPAALGDHIDRLYRAARALCGSREEAEDLVQDTFARVLRKPRMLHSKDDLGYLLRVLRNTFISARRAAARRPQAIVPPDTAGSSRICRFLLAGERTGKRPAALSAGRRSARESP
jgi:DNA-directed RNA polymerase specialized sigma24 family protein